MRRFSLALVLLAPLCVWGLCACGDEVTTETAGAGGGGSSASSTGGGSSLSNVLEGAQLGDPQLLSAQRLAFGPGGVLLIGDGRSERIVAVETGDTSELGRADNGFALIDNIPGLAADVIGADVASNDLLIEDIAINPASHVTYIAITRISTMEPYVLWVDANTDLHLFDMSNIVHAAVDIRPTEGAAARVADLVWGETSVIGSVTPQSALRHEITYVETPFAHESGASHTTTRVFHRSWNQWITEQPMDQFFTFSNETGEQFLAGSFTSSVAIFEAADLEDGASEEPGDTVFDLLDGRWVVDFLPYERDDELYVIMSVMNFFFDGQIKAVRVPGSLFTNPEGINPDAPILFDFSGEPLVEGIERAQDLDAAQRIAARGDTHAVILRGNSLSTELLP